MAKRAHEEVEDFSTTASDGEAVSSCTNHIDAARPLGPPRPQLAGGRIESWVPSAKKRLGPLRARGAGRPGLPRLSRCGGEGAPLDSRSCLRGSRAADGTVCTELIELASIAYGTKQGERSARA